MLLVTILRFLVNPSNEYVTRHILYLRHSPSRNDKERALAYMRGTGCSILKLLRALEATQVPRYNSCLRRHSRHIKACAIANPGVSNPRNWEIRYYIQLP